MSEPWLILETSGRVGRVGVTRDGRVLRSASLDETRRHARDLAATMDSLLKQEAISPKDLHGVMVGIGSGSYTGLRVGVVSAKVLAYATGCHLVAVPTFRAIVERVPTPFTIVDVIGDALQGHIYVQRYVRAGVGWTSADELRIEPATTWASGLTKESAVTGPGVAAFDSVIPDSAARIPAELREPTVESVFAAGMALTPLERDAIFRLEPLYLRGSSAEEKAKKEGNARTGVPFG